MEGQRSKPMELSQQEMRSAHNYVKDNCDGDLSWETFQKRFPEVYEKLLKTAKSESKITYGDLAAYAGTSPRKPLSELLDGIEHLQAEKGNPGLTVLVVKANTNRPSDDGFPIIIDRYDLYNRYQSSTEEALIDEITDHFHEVYGTE
jgi:hypothetical protein